MKSLAPLLAAAAMAATAASAFSASDYAVVVSKTTWADPAWKRVAESFVEKHARATVIPWETRPEEALPALKSDFPRYVCFVATPGETTADFVAQVHRLTRRLDDDPYTDVFWGILTGHDADNALAIAAETAPLTIRKAASGTEIALDRIVEGICYDELKQGHSVRKLPGQSPPGRRASRQEN